MLLNMVMFKVTICDLKNKDRNMADYIEHQDKIKENWSQIVTSYKMMKS